MRAVGVIPARFAATRLPGKPLRSIMGKPLIQWVVEGARRSRLLDEVWVATDHPEIAAVASALGVRAVMTDPNLPTGSDRVFAAVRDARVDVVVNVQGDEPLIDGELLDALVAPMLEDSSLAMATLARRLDVSDLRDLNVAKVVVNRLGDAIYFSRFPIPYSRITDPGMGSGQGVICLRHMGLYAFRRDFLSAFCAQPPTPLELAEGLEQLRALYLGGRIRVVTVEKETFEVNAPEDIPKVEAILRSRL